MIHRWAVPHNIFSAAKFNAHINVEICNQIDSLKYAYNFEFKGHDRAHVYIGTNKEDFLNEIRNSLYAKYVPTSETCWRFFSFPMHKEFPASQRLDIHIEGERVIYFEENDHPSEVLNRNLLETTLTAWFKYKLNSPPDLQAKGKRDYLFRFL